MQAVLDTDIHLDRAVGLGRHTVRIDPNLLLADHVRHAPGNRNSDKVPQSDIDAVIGLVLFLDVLEVEREGLRVVQLARCRELLIEGQKFVMVASVVEHFYDRTSRRISLYETAMIYHPQ